MRPLLGKRLCLAGPPAAGRQNPPQPPQKLWSWVGVREIPASGKARPWMTFSISLGLQVSE